MPQTVAAYPRSRQSRRCSQPNSASSACSSRRPCPLFLARGTTDSAWRSPALIHNTLLWIRLFADAEVAEDHVQDVLDIDPASEASERPGGDAQFLGQQILTGRHLARLGAAESGHHLLERAAVARAGDDRLFGSGQEGFGLPGQLIQKPVETVAGDGRYIELIFATNGL